jgi:SAM-dependent methyltransferase
MADAADVRPRGTASTPVGFRSRNGPSRSWDPIAAWYSGWVGSEGSRFHRLLAVPALLRMLQPKSGERILDLGCGPGVLAPYFERAGAFLIGVDSSPRLIAIARRRHGQIGRFLVGDATRLERHRDLSPASFDAAAFLLSIQDIEPLADAIRSAAWALRSQGRVAILMTHPCFRVPRQSGWGWDEKRALRFRRVDRYLSPLAVPMQQYSGGKPGFTCSYHRPLEDYFAALMTNGFIVDGLREVAAAEIEAGPEANRATVAACREFPLFLALRAVKR